MVQSYIYAADCSLSEVDFAALIAKALHKRQLVAVDRCCIDHRVLEDEVAQAVAHSVAGSGMDLVRHKILEGVEADDLKLGWTGAFQAQEVRVAPAEGLRSILIEMPVVMAAPVWISGVVLVRIRLVGSRQARPGWISNRSKSASYFELFQSCPRHCLFSINTPKPGSAFVFCQLALTSSFHSAR